VPYYYTRSQQQPARKRLETMTHDEKNVLYWIIGAARFGYVDMNAVQEWAGSNMDPEELTAIVQALWNSLDDNTDEQEETEYDDPALDPDNEFCSCGNMTDNFPVICDHCGWMARA
jgi:hypothetical protein